jgi:hypothetical protein
MGRKYDNKYGVCIDGKAEKYVLMSGNTNERLGSSMNVTVA